MSATSKVIKTYMPFSLPLDPANVRTLVDLDLSYALGATLVGWSPAREPVSALAESWEPTGKEIAFKLAKNAKWSDGSPVTAAQVVRSFERAKKTDGDSLKSLFDMVEKIEAKDAHTVVFKLNLDAAKSGIVRKVTEPMYGVLFVKEDGSLDLTKTTGAFVLKSVSESALDLVVNKNWLSYRPDMAETISIRRPPKGEEIQESFLHDSWANLVGSSSLIPEAMSQEFRQAHYAVWNRNLDKVFFMSPSPRLANDEGRSLFRFLNTKLDRKKIMQGLSGYSLSDQFFPQGYVLYDPEFKKKVAAADLPPVFHKRPLEILGADSRLGSNLRENIGRAIQAVTGVAPKFKIVSLSDFERTRAQGDYDFVAALLAEVEGKAKGQ